MPRCPKGHESGTSDYCDVCGAAMAPAHPTTAPDRPAALAVVSADPMFCPDCGSLLNGRFCEVDGFDAFATPSPAVRVAPTAAPVPTESAGWHVVVSADRAFFDQVEAHNGPDPGIVFPRFCPDRRFPLTGEQVLIGRRSRTRGTYPDIDLTGPPEDVAVSHLHALLVARPDGGWAVVDVRSANRTYVRGDPDPIDPESPVPLADGDHIHVGAWTRITLRATPLA